MRGQLAYVFFRALFVLGCLGAGLLGWPGPTGAWESMLNAGSVDATGARRIVVESQWRQTEPEGDPMRGLLRRLLGSLDPEPVDLSEVLTDPKALPHTLSSVLEVLRKLPRNLSIVREQREQAMARARAVAAALAETDRAGGGGQAARAKRLQVEAARSSRVAMPAEALFAELGQPRPILSPYEASLAALADSR